MEEGDESDYSNSGSDTDLDDEMNTVHRNVSAQRNVNFSDVQRNVFRTRLLHQVNTRTDLGERMKERLRSIIRIMGDEQLNMAIRMSEWEYTELI